MTGRERTGHTTDCAMMGCESTPNCNVTQLRDDFGRAYKALETIAAWTCCYPNGRESPHTRHARETLLLVARSASALREGQEGMEQKSESVSSPNRSEGKR